MVCVGGGKRRPPFACPFGRCLFGVLVAILPPTIAAEAAVWWDIVDTFNGWIDRFSIARDAMAGRACIWGGGGGGCCGWRCMAVLFCCNVPLFSSKNRKISALIDQETDPPKILPRQLPANLQLSELQCAGTYCCCCCCCGWCCCCAESVRWCGCCWWPTAEPDGICFNICNALSTASLSSVSCVYFVIQIIALRVFWSMQCHLVDGTNEHTCRAISFNRYHCALLSLPFTSAVSRRSSTILLSFHFNVPDFLF